MEGKSRDLTQGRQVEGGGREAERGKLQLAKEEKSGRKKNSLNS